MRIGELADRACVTPKTIRYYESIGLLPEPGRTESGYRDYHDSAVQRLETVRTARELGLSLHQIGQALHLGADGPPPCGYVLGVLEEHVETVAGRIRELELLQSRLTALIAAAAGIPASAPGSCRLIEHAGRHPAGRGRDGN
ncbi:MAG: Zn(2+)-responsive transcriptional regulator [Pseudarthrobacter sp.]